MRRYSSRCGLIFLSIILAAGVAGAQSKPRLGVKNSSFDFGTISEGAKVQHDFTITNDGDAELTIQRVVAACGCTATNITDTKIAPGGSTAVKVEFDSAGFSGPVQKAVRIYSDDPAQPIALVSLSGAVTSDVSIEPKTVAFDKLTRENIAGQSREVVVSVNPKGPLTIESVSSFSKFVKIEELESAPRRRRLRVSLAPEIASGQFRDRLIVNLKGGPRGSVNVPILASIGGVFTFEPPAISFGLIAGGNPIKRRAKFESSAAAPVKLSSVESNHPAVTAAITPIMEGRSYWIDVTLDPSKVNRDLRASVRLLPAGDGVKEELSLNVYGVLAPKTTG